MVAKAVGALVGRAAVEGQAGPHPARLEGEAPAVRVEGSGPDGSQELAAVLDLEAREVDRAAVGGGPHGGRADPALDLDAVHAAREVAEIDEVQGGVLGLAQGHPVEGEVDPGLLDAPQVEVGVAGPHAGVGVLGDRGGLLEQVRHLLAVVGLLDLRPVHVLLGDGGAGIRADRLHDHVLGEPVDRIEPEVQGDVDRHRHAPRNRPVAGMADPQPVVARGDPQAEAPRRVGGGRGRALVDGDGHPHQGRARRRSHGPGDREALVRAQRESARECKKDSDEGAELSWPWRSPPPIGWGVDERGCRCFHGNASRPNRGFEADPSGSLDERGVRRPVAFPTPVSTGSGSRV